MTAKKGPQHQEEAEVQELRGQGPAEEGRQGRQMPALRRDGLALARRAAPTLPPLAHVNIDVEIDLADAGLLRAM